MSTHAARSPMLLPAIKKLLKDVTPIANKMGKTAGDQPILQMPTIPGLKAPQSPTIRDAANALDPQSALSKITAGQVDQAPEAYKKTWEKPFKPGASIEDRMSIIPMEGVSIKGGKVLDEMLPKIRNGAKVLADKRAAKANFTPKAIKDNTLPSNSDNGLAVADDLKAKPGAAQPTANQSAQQLPPIGKKQTPWQEFSDHQKYYQPDPNQKAIRQIKLPKENDPVGAENAVHETLDRHGITNPTAEEQLAVLPEKRNQLYTEAKTIIDGDPDVAQLSTITKHINTELSSQTRLKDISLPAAQKAQKGYIQGLYNAATGRSLNQGDTIPYSTLLDMKTIANRDYSAIQKKILNNQPLSDTDKINYAFRNGLDKTISERYPDVKQHTLDMSNLYKAQGPLESARPKFEAPPPAVPQESFSKKLMQTGIGAATLAGAGAEVVKGLGIDPIGAAISGFKTGQNFLSQLPGNLQKAYSGTDGTGQGKDGIDKSKEFHGGTIPQPIGNVNDVSTAMDNVGKGNDNYSVQSPDTIKGASGQSVGITNDAYQTESQRLQALTTSYAYLNNVNNTKQIVDSQIRNLDRKYNDPQNQQLVKDFKDDQKAEQSMKTAYNQLQQVAPELSQQFGNGNFSWEAVRTATDPKYIQLKTELSAISARYPDLDKWLQGAKTQEGVQKVIQAAHIRLLQDYYAGIASMSGGIGSPDQKPGANQTPYAPTPEQSGLNAPPPPNPDFQL